MVALILTAIGLGFGLAIDAFSVSLANGLHEPEMKPLRAIIIAGTFAVFQGIMPLIGWVAVHTVLEYFSMIGRIVPWIAFGLLAFIGGKMIIEGARGECQCDGCEGRASVGLLAVQGIATSIDALSVGFAIADNTLTEALISVVLISALTFGICLVGIIIGKLFGRKIANKASVFGGTVLVAVGLEILISSLLYG